MPATLTDCEQRQSEFIIQACLWLSFHMTERQVSCRMTWMSHLRGFNLCVVFEVWCLLIRVKSPSCAALFESARCEDSLFKRSYMKNSKLAWGGHSHAAVDLLLPGYIMFHNKKFDQDTTGSINGYYILLTSFSFLLLPLTIFCMNERPSRRTE